MSTNNQQNQLVSISKFQETRSIHKYLLVFLDTSNEYSKPDIKNTAQFMIVAVRKYAYIQWYIKKPKIGTQKSFKMKQIKENLNEWKQIPCSWTEIVSILNDYNHKLIYQFSSVQFPCSVMSDYLRSHAVQHARPSCLSPTPEVYSNSCPLSQ